MSNYRTEQRELEKAIKGANDLVCAINTVGDAGGYVGAVNVLVQTVKTHMLDLKAMYLRMSQYDEELKADGRYKLLLDEITSDYIDTAAELSGYVEILDGLKSRICTFDGSEPRAERNSAQDSLYALHRSIARFKDAQDEQANRYAVQRHSLEVKGGIIA